MKQRAAALSEQFSPTAIEPPRGIFPSHLELFGSTTAIPEEGTTLGMNTIIDAFDDSPTETTPYQD